MAPMAAPETSGPRIDNNDRFPLFGVGGSAGALVVLRAFFEAMPPRRQGLA